MKDYDETDVIEEENTQNTPHGDEDLALNEDENTRREEVLDAVDSEEKATDDNGTADVAQCPDTDATSADTDEQAEKERKHNPLGIAEDDIWTYRIEGLSAPHINKPYTNFTLKKICFTLVILVAISLSIYFSFSAVSKDTFEYTKLDGNAYQLKEFRNTSYIKDLNINYYTDIVYNRDISDPATNFTLTEQTDKPITEIREYAFNCDGYLTGITIGKNVTKIDGRSFYYCTALECIYVDDDNPYYADVDGVLYNKDLTEVICYPIKHSAYLQKKYGYKAVNEEDGTAGQDDGLTPVPSKEDANYGLYEKQVLTYVVPSTVTKIGQLCFNYTDLAVVYLPEGVKSIETLAFFKATALHTVNSYACATPITATDYVGDTALGTVYRSLPEGLEYIGSDAFSYDQALSYVYIPSAVKHIGHHAFWDTVYKEDKELKGVTAINLALSEEEFEKQCSVGNQWRPRYDYMLFKKTVDTHYSAERE